MIIGDAWAVVRAVDNDGIITACVFKLEEICPLSLGLLDNLILVALVYKDIIE